MACNLAKNVCRTVVVEGNIASGKTAFLDYFGRLGKLIEGRHRSETPPIKIFEEPVKQWRDVHGFNTLDLMYTNPSRWSFAFQSYVQLTMLDAHTRYDGLGPNGIKFMERSIYSAKYCFVENLLHNNLMERVEYHILTEWFNWIISTVQPKIDLIVYLRTKPETVFERLRKRNRPEERSVSMEYLEKLHTLHEDWLVHEKIYQQPARVLEIDANHDLNVMSEQYKALAEVILGWPKKHISELTQEDSYNGMVASAM